MLSSESRDGLRDLFGLSLVLVRRFLFLPFPSEDTGEAEAGTGIAESETGACIATSKGGAGTASSEAGAGIVASEANGISEDGNCYWRGLFRRK